MAEKTQFQNSPYRITVEAHQKFAYCRCGHADSFPLCDGAHRTYGSKPLKFTPDKTQKLTLCRCGNSKTVPHCDGTHLTSESTHA